MRPLALPVLALLAAGLAGCGGGGGEAQSPVETGAVVTSKSSSGSALPRWVASELDAKDGADVALVMGSSDFAVGKNRVTFLVIRNDNSLVQSPTARVRYGADRPIDSEAEAKLVPLEPHSHGSPTGSHDHADITDIYVADLAIPKPGRYWLVVDPVGDEIQGVSAIDVRAQTISPPIGSKAPASDTPTLADAPVEKLTTGRPPRVELLRHSIADTLRDHVPFVAVFATPAFCQSRTCGPTVEVVDKVRSTSEGSGIRFIHVEIYEDNDPQKGFNRWVREWNLPTEPWVFLVDGAGVVRAKFEGSVSVEELEPAVREHLRTAP